MALKALLFILAFVLLISTKVTSTEEEILTIKPQNDGGHARAPAHAPVKPPGHSPRKAPAYSPHKSPTPGYGYPPKTRPPAYSPKVSPHHNHGNCIPLCLDYCKSEKHSKRRCLRACVPCCDEYQCVPRPHQKCLKWDKVIYRGRYIQCPKY